MAGRKRRTDWSTWTTELYDAFHFPTVSICTKTELINIIERKSKAVNGANFVLEPRCLANLLGISKESIKAALVRLEVTGFVEKMGELPKGYFGEIWVYRKCEPDDQGDEEISEEQSEG